MKTDKTYINEDGSIDFDKFNLLSENEQKNEMLYWTEKQWIDYMSQTPALTEEECFGPILAKIEKEIQENESGI